MASTYSANLKIELMGTGDQTGLWGVTTNTNLGTAIEEAITGRATANFTADADLTLTLTDANTTQVARNLYLNVTSGVSLSTTRNLVVPTINKQYLVKNATTGGRSIVVKTAAGSGITVANGQTAHVFVDGTDVVLADSTVVQKSGDTMTGPLAQAAGSAALPSYTFSGDTNTGMWSPSADILAWSTAGTERLRIDTSGNVGIGTASPTVASGTGVAVYSSSVSRVQLRNATTGDASTDGCGLFASGTDMGVENRENGSTIFYTNNAERMRIDASGNVGIGTTAPISGAGVTVGNDGNGGATVKYSFSTAQTERASISLTGSTAEMRLSAGYAGYGGQMRFFTNGTEKLQIEVGTGNVLVTGSGGLGYGVGSGGFVDQTGARTSGVALNKPSGQITLSSAAGSTTWTSFTLTNSSIGAFDGVVVTQRSGTDLYEIHVTAKAAGSCRISFRTTGGTTVEQPVFDFQVIKGSAS